MINQDRIQTSCL